MAEALDHAYFKVTPPPPLPPRSPPLDRIPIYLNLLTEPNGRISMADALDHAYFKVTPPLSRYINLPLNHNHYFTHRTLLITIITLTVCYRGRM